MAHTSLHTSSDSASVSPRGDWFPPATQRQSRGFTIVELLIVIVVIAILAAITIVAYNGIANRAKETALKSDLHGGATQLQITKETGGSYPGDSSSLKKSDGTTKSAVPELARTVSKSAYSSSVIWSN